MEKLKNKQTKIIFIVVSILLIMPSIIYMIQNRTLLGFNKYYNFFITDKISKTISTYIYLCLLGLMIISYYKLIQNKKEFKNIKEFLKYVIIISCIFLFMIPWTSSDIFYYMAFRSNYQYTFHNSTPFSFHSFTKRLYFNSPNKIYN